MLPATCIIPAYNEEKYIYKNLTQLKKYAIFPEIIVVNDGSTDNTLKEIHRAKYVLKNILHIINLPQNKGKGYAIAEGIKKASYDILYFHDADMLSMRKEHFEIPIKILMFDLADMVLAYRETDYTIFKDVTGDRTIKKELVLKHLKHIRTSGRGLELYLNHVLRDKRIMYFKYPGLKQTGKASTIIGRIRALPEYVHEGLEFLLGFTNAVKYKITQKILPNSSRSSNG